MRPDIQISRCEVVTAALWAYAYDIGKVLLVGGFPVIGKAELEIKYCVT